MNAEVLLYLYYCGCFVVKFNYKIMLALLCLQEKYAKVSPRLCGILQGVSCSKSQLKQGVLNRFAVQYKARYLNLNFS
jgi:hypothetical protein